jgi:hypothetical protein
MSGKLLGLFLVAVMLLSCKKEPGEGGTSTIRGKVLVQDYDDESGELQAEYYGVEERVYIIYGEEDFYGNDTRTSFDGSFEFHFLRKGNYTVFAYSECDTCPSGFNAVTVDAEITENHSTVELSDLIVRR